MSFGSPNSGAIWDLYVRKIPRRFSRWSLMEIFVNTEPAGSCHLRSITVGNRMNSYSNEELVDMLIVYVAADCNVHATRLLY
ncbi:hypothetical protein TNCV_3869201 [Trichonephila clavipes]|nr:hypothetical protein TNCV_3869201 [Trichonephila clavipes]